MKPANASRAIAVLVPTLFTGLLFGMDAACQLIVQHPAVRQFVLSPLFWPTVIGIAVIIGSSGAALMFHPARLTGRNVPERGE